MLVVQATTAEISPSWLVYPLRSEAIARWAARMNCHEAGQFLGRIYEIQKARMRNINLQLAMETLLMTLRDFLV